MVKLLQVVQLVFKQTKQACTTPVLITLHWLPVAACINFKSLVLTYRVLAGSAPSYLNNCVPAHLIPVHSVPHISVIWQSCVYRQANSSFFILFPNSGTTSRAPSKQGNPLFLHKAPTALPSAPALRTALIFLLQSRLTSALLFSCLYPLHSLSITLHCWLVVTLVPGSLGP